MQFVWAMGSAITRRVMSSGVEDEVVESTVCRVEDLNNGEMRDVDVDGKKVLLVKEKGEFHALGSKCTHYNAPLSRGALSNGHVRCPFHGACFSIHTGDIEDFPGLDSIPKYQVTVVDGEVKVRAKKCELANMRRVKKPVSCTGQTEKKTVLIVGGGAAALTCAETLRQEGFHGDVIIATQENVLPYDRPKLSKSLDSPADRLLLRAADFYESYNITVKLEKRAIKVDTGDKAVYFDDGDCLHYDQLFIATGGKARTMHVPGSDRDFDNIFYLRSPTDGNDIAKAAQDKHVVIVGTSFIGMETASFLVKKCASVTMVGHTPFENVLGAEIGKFWQRIHEAKGIKFVTGVRCSGFEGSNDTLTNVVLSDGSKLAADVCVLGVGVDPATSFLNGTDLSMNERGYVKVNKRMESSVRGVYAGGDVVEFPLFLADDAHVNIQHWQMALQHGRIAALNMLGKNEDIHSVPFFWTQMFGKSLRYCGYGAGYEEIITHGDMEAMAFVSFYIKGGIVVAAASVGYDPIVAQVAEIMLTGEKLTKDEVKDDPKAWLSRLVAT